MPPPPPLFVAPAPVARKRPRDTVAEDPVSLPGIAASMGMHFFIATFTESLSTQTCLLHDMASPPHAMNGGGVETCVNLSTGRSH